MSWSVTRSVTVLCKPDCSCGKVFISLSFIGTFTGDRSLRNFWGVSRRSIVCEGANKRQTNKHGWHWCPQHQCKSTFGQIVPMNRTEKVQRVAISAAPLGTATQSNDAGGATSGEGRWRHQRRGQVAPPAARVAPPMPSSQGIGGAAIKAPSEKWTRIWSLHSLAAVVWNLHRRQILQNR